MNLDNVSSIFYNNKEVVSIKNLLNDEYIYQKKNDIDDDENSDINYIELNITGDTFSTYSARPFYLLEKSL